MARTIFEISALLSSPDDIKEERELLEDVIRNLNIMLTNHTGKRIELVKWETHCYPGISTDVQSNVNEQIGDDYDIFIGIMWKKFGTPTPRAGSGTAEEFERAYKRFQQDPKSVKIMFYFKDAVPSSMSEIDPYQLALVNEFRKQLSEKGVMYSSFKTQTELQSLIYVHMAPQIFDWGEKWGCPKEAVIIEPLPIVSGAEAEDNEPCIEDLFKICQESLDDVGAVSFRIAGAMDVIGAKMNKRCEEIARANMNAADMRKHMGDLVAADIEAFVESMNKEIPLFGESYSTGLDALGRAVALSTISTELDKRALVGTLNTVRAMRRSLMEALISVDTYRNVAANSPLVSNAFNRAKRRAVTVLDLFFSEMSGALKTTSEIERAVMEIIDDRQ